MTREEAIEMLKALNMMLRSPNGEPISDVCDALGMAIESLQRDIERHEMVIRASENYLGIVRCKDCRHADECHKSVQYTRNDPRTVTIGYSPIEWCSRGERSEE